MTKPVESSSATFISEDDTNSSFSYYIKYYFYILLVLLLVLLFGYVAYRVLVFPGGGFVIGKWLLSVDPAFMSALGLVLAFGMSVVGAGWGILICASSLLGASVQVPRVRTKNLINVLVCEAVAIYGILGIVVLKGLFTSSPTIITKTYYHCGFSIFWAGFTIGFCNLVSALSVGVSGSVAVLADARDKKMFVKTLIVTIFASAIGLFGLIVGLILATGIEKH